MDAPMYRRDYGPPVKRGYGPPLPTKDGGTLRTIGEACGYMTNMDKKRELRDHWQRVCKLILAKEDIHGCQARRVESLGEMRTRTHFAHRIDRLDAAGEIQEHLAGVEDYILAEAAWREGIARRPDATDQARVSHHLAAEDKDHDSNSAADPIREIG
jgi:hypothetical protein